MSIPPVGAPEISQVPETSFDDVMKKVQNASGDTNAQDEVLVGGVALLAQTILMPRMNEMLSEAMSDE